MRSRLSSAIIAFGLALTVSANVVPNSSFEAGVGDSWFVLWKSSGFGGLKYPMSYYLSADQARTGTRSLLINKYDRYNSRPFWCGQTGTWSFSFYGYGTAGGPWTLYAGVQPRASMGSVPGDSYGVTSSSWNRYSGTFSVTTVGWYSVVFETETSSNSVYVDDVQVEPGASPTTYAPMHPVEIGISIDNTNHEFYTNDTPTMTLRGWNTGPATNVGVVYLVRDVKCQRYASNCISLSMAAETNTDEQVTLPGDFGWFIVDSRMTNYNNTQDQATYVHLNRAAGDTNNWAAGHFHAFPWEVDNQTNLSIWNTRSLSPEYYGFRWTSIEASSNSFVWYDPAVTNVVDRGVTILANIGQSGNAPGPDWSTNLTWANYLLGISNMSFRVAEHYAAQDSNIVYELGNEPQGGRVVCGRDYSLATNYAQVAAAQIAGLTNGDPNVRVCFFGGITGYQSYDWLITAWTNLTADEQGYVVMGSCHIYVAQPPNYDPNKIDSGSATGILPSSNFVYRLKSFDFPGEIINSESGAYQEDPIDGMPLPNRLDLTSSFPQEGDRWEKVTRNYWTTLSTAIQFLEDIGRGMSLYYWYDNRSPNSSCFAGTDPYGWDLTGTPQPQIAALVNATRFINAPGGGFIQNANTDLIAFSCLSPYGEAVAPVWTYDRTNAVITLGTAVASYDVMGNLVESNTVIHIGRCPVYLVAAPGLSQSEMSNNVANATVTDIADTNAPNVAIVMAPTGEWENGDASAIWLRPIDDHWQQTDSSKFDSGTNAILLTLNVDGTDIFTLSQSNYYDPGTWSAGNHTLTATATDASGNASSTTYSFVPLIAENTNVIMIAPWFVK